MSRRALVLVALLASAVQLHAQPAAYRSYRTLDTPHFRVHVRAGLEREGRVAGAHAERAYAQLAAELAEPRGPIDLIVTDDADYANGNAGWLPLNRIVVFTTAPVESKSLRLNEDWLGIVITHELAHVFHLDRSRGIWRLAQRIFGRAPGWFPNAYAPSWFIEGLAVYYESRFSEGGRLRDPEHRMFARAAALEHRIPHLNALSRSTPVFPGGGGTYAYGSLFVEHLARTRGDTTVRRFIDAQSAGIIPWRLNTFAKRSFGVSLSDAYSTWRDSVERSVAASVPAPLPGWRELTSHGYYALDPRWLTDSTLVYWANDARSTPGAYELGLDGERRRIGRRNTTGASVPFLDGGLLFAQFDYSARDEVRSDLYVERDGKQRKLTDGWRLIQPDARRDGHIVAVQLAESRASLIVIDPEARQSRLLRIAGADETWSEPRWSPRGDAMTAIHRAHGGTFSLEVIDVASGTARVLDRGKHQMYAPSWTPDGRWIQYITEESGVPTIARAESNGASRAVSAAVGGAGVYAIESSPGGGTVAAVSLRADGYHVGVAPAPAIARLPNTTSSAAPAVDSQPLSPGEFHRYSAWRSILPTHWVPRLESSPSGGFRFGASTTGRDALRRHIYDANVAFTSRGFYPVAALAYRFGGFRKPFVDVNLSQDYTREASLVNGGTRDTLGYLLRNTQNASLGATFIRPRIRSYASFSFGGALERRSFTSDRLDLLKQLNIGCVGGCHFPSVYLSSQWSNLQRPGRSISPEDGVSLAYTARARTRYDSIRARMSASVVGTAAGFKSLDLPGFAHHVIALRLAGGFADRRAATAFQIGGTSGGTLEIIPTYTVGEGRKTFGVRGFPAGTSFGNRAAAGVLEYRLPLVLGGRGLGMLPVFFDRSSVSAFADAAVAACADAPLNPVVCARAPRIGRTFASTGAELVLSAAVLDWDATQNFRLGVAVPVAGRAVAGVNAVSAHLAYGLSF